MNLRSSEVLKPKGRATLLLAVEGYSPANRPHVSPAYIRFGQFELDVRAAELRKGGTRIRLQDQPFQILLMLLAHPGEVVLREEILRKLWPGDTVVEFDQSINAAVKRLRDALRESAEKPRHIETLARRGYRFIGQVEPVSVPPAPAEVPDEVSTTVATQAVDLPPKMRFPPVRMALLPLIAAIALAGLAALLSYRHGAPARWARKVALPEATRLVEAGKYAPALSFLLRAERAIPEDPTLKRIRREISHPASIRTIPSGATVWVKAYEEPGGEWLPLGPSPIENFLLPLAYFRWKIEKPGFHTLEAGGGFLSDTLEFRLDPEVVPPDMVHIPAGTFQLLSLNPVRLDDYWMDKYEITNRQFKRFIEAGGYRDRKYWREKFFNQSRVLAWDEAMAEFHDGTGMPGPSTWELGDYPPGHDEFPVNGVSWYEAAAYAEFAHKQLPSIYHWYRAANQGIHSEIVMFSNFDGSGPARVGSYSGLGPFGTYDMAGNVREWCWNATGNRRYVVGGAWHEPRYAYSSTKAALPFDRSPANGFRCVTYPGGPISATFTDPIEKPARDRGAENPVTDREFRILQNFYSYDHTPLKAVTESVDESSRDWRMEKISFDAAYGNQRIVARLYLPRNARPPYQTVVYFPPRSALYLRSIDDFELRFIAFLVKTGRAVLYPVYQGMYERRLTTPVGPSGERDRVIEQSKDLRRSLDYLETRPDIALARLGYYGISDGARLGLIQLAEEARFRAAVLSAGGLSPEKKPLEIDEINFAPRVRVPVLMLNGRYDFMYAAESDQAQMFRLLGTADKDKRYVLYDSGHVPIHEQEIKETLSWFDRYLGPVEK